MPVKSPQPFGSWEPDKGVLASTATEAKGVYSMGGRYLPLRGTTQYGSNARTTNRCIGAFGAKATSGNVVNFFGDSTALYRMNNRTLLNVSRAGGYTADADAAWKFDQYNNYVIATIRGAPAQILEIGSGGEFADLGGGAGEGDTCGRIGPHFIVVQDKEVRISAFNNPTDYEPAPDTQAGIAYLDQRGGMAHAVFGGTEVGAIFQERMISRMAYVGGVSAFDLQPVEFDRGCLGPLAVAQLGRLSFYASEHGIFAFDGAQSVPIGENQVDRYFLSRLNYTYRNRVCLAIDTERKCLTVAFPGGSGQDITEMLVYSLPDRRWTHDDCTAQMLFEMPREGVSIDDDAAVIAVAGTTDLDSISLSIDSPAWRETRKQWAAVDQDRYVVIFDGDTRPARLETAEVEAMPGRQSFVTEILPITDATPAAVSVNIMTKTHRFDETATVGTASDMNQYGVCPVRAHSRYMRTRLNIAAAANWTEAVGIHTDARVAGER